MKTFRTVGSGSTQTIEPIENNKIPVYETKTAAENDLANLEVGQIIATKDEGNELSNPVDVVQDGNMHAVTSNAVADFAFDKSKIRMGAIVGGSANSDNWIATFDIPFPDTEYTAVVIPSSFGGGGNCPSGWYIVNKQPTGFNIYCNGSAPQYGFQYIAIHE